MLLERVFLRIGSADSDEQLETALGKFLTPVLLKLSSPEESVRKKVMELLVHVNKRLKSRPKVLLPVEPLLTQYQDPSASPFITNFTVLYIKMGYPRLQPDKQAELIPMLINCMEGKPQPQQDSLFQLVVPALQYVKITNVSAKVNPKFGLSEKPNISKQFLDFMMDVLLLPYNAHVSVSASSDGSDGRPATAPARNPATAPPLVVPPGMSEQSLKRVTGDNPLKPEELEKCKLGILNFLGGGIFPDDNVVCHYVIAAADTRHSIATAADMELKRIMGSIDWNSPAIINKLYGIFLGTIVIKGKGGNVKPECRKVAASTRIRLKLFPYFLKSREATNIFPACIQVIFDCLFGAINHARLKLMAVQLVHHVCLSCSDTKFNPISPVLLSGMVKLLGMAKEDDKLRGLTYVAVGKIVKRCPSLIAKDISLVQNFFDAVCKEDSERRLAVQEALSLMAEPFRSQDEANKKLMEALIMENIDKAEYQARSVAVQYAKSVFKQNHIPSRYVLLLATGDVRDDIRSEALKGLLLSGYDNSRLTKEDKILPDFCEMTTYIYEKAEHRINSEFRHMSANHTLAFSPSCFNSMIVYLRQCLAASAEAEAIAGKDASPSTFIGQAPWISRYVNKQLDTSEEGKGPVHMYIKLIQQLLTAESDECLMYCLLEVIAGAADRLAGLFWNQLNWIKRLSCSTKEDMREHAAQLYSVVLHNASDVKSVISSLQEFHANLDSKNLELQHSSILMLGYIIGQQMRQASDPQAMEQEGLKEIYEAMQNALKRLAFFLKDGSSILCSGACIALGEIGRNGALPLPNGSEDDTEDSEEVTKLSVVKSLLRLVQSIKEKDPTKNKEHASTCLGNLCVGDADFPYTHMVIEGLMSAVQAKQMELHMTIAEALVCAALGATSPSGRNIWVQQEKEFKASVANRSDDVEWYLLKLLKEHIHSPNHHVRQASCIWLLSLVKHCGHHAALQKRLPDIQAAFMQLLSENDEITQDFTSKGLALVYENCSAEQKNVLVQELVETLMTGKSSRTNVTENTEIFESGALGKTPEGGSMSTYRELCSIASDLNQPDLIYKFMHLANHQATWNSKKGAAFGFSSIAQFAGEQLAPFLPKIVPRLYRYQFDPNPKVQRAMTSIWESVVTDNKKTLDLYIHEIMDDLLKNLTAREWRVRESSCHAVSDLLRGRQINAIVDKLPTLWEICLQVRDDIKESVRTAADQTCKHLSRLSIKVCDVNNGKVGEKAFSLVLPCLLKHSLQSQVQEVRAIGLSTILKMTKNAGKLIKPHIPLLVIALLEAVSGLEPQVMNYLAVRAGAGSQATQEKLDLARIAASKSSPMMETVNFCVQYVDSSILPELVPRIIELVKGGIGVGTKAGCASFITLLVTQCPHDLAPHAGKLMSAMLTGLSDRNLAVRKAYASALGHLVKVATDSSTEKLMIKLKTWYMEKDEAAQIACRITLHAISHHNPDILKRHAALVMPFVFFAMHEQKDAEKEPDMNIWDDVWFEITPGTESGIRLYLTEITEILSNCLESQMWNTKAQAATAIGSVAKKLGKTLESPSLDLLLLAVLKGLSGRTWKGKENLLEALENICCSCQYSLQDRTESSDESKPSLPTIVDVVLRECKKENTVYRMRALQCAGRILELYEIDRFETLWLLLQPTLNKSESELNEEGDGTACQLGIQGLYQESVFDCLGNAWPKVEQTQTTYQEAYCDQLCHSLTRGGWKTQVSIMKSMHKFLERLLLWKDEETVKKNIPVATKIVNQILSSVIPCLANMKYTMIRSESLAVITRIIQKLKDLDNRSLMTEKLKEELIKGLDPFMENKKNELYQKVVDIRVLLGLPIDMEH